MTIGVMSDTHKNIELMNKAAGLMADRFAVERIYHLGDDYEDADALDGRGVQIARIPGIYDREYADSTIPKRLTDDVAGTVILAAHSTKTIPQVEIDGADIVLAGHTHLYEITPVGNAVVFNPGHLKDLSDKGREPTFGIIEIGGNAVRLTVHDLQGEVVETRELRK